MNIHSNQLLSSILVNENVRPACMLQHYGNEIQNPKVIPTLDKILSYFPNLKLTQTNHGLIICKNSVNPKQTDEEIGLTLGYPAVSEYKNINLQKTSYSLSLNSEIMCSDESIIKVHIFANTAMIYEPYIQQFEQLRINAEKALNKQEYIDLLSTELNKNIISINIKFEISALICIKDIVLRLASGEKLNEYEIKEIKEKIKYISYLFGDGFFETFDFENKIHIGMLIVILMDFDFNKKYVFSYEERMFTTHEFQYETDKLIERLTFYLKDNNVQYVIENEYNSMHLILDDDKFKIFERLHQFYNPYHIGIIVGLIGRKITCGFIFEKYQNNKTIKTKMNKLENNFNSYFELVMDKSKIEE
jgi:hypothetical protein